MSSISCPTCGAINSSVISNCEYCGVEFSKAQELTPQEFVTAIGKAIVKVRNSTGRFSNRFDKDEAEETAMKAIPIPSDIPTLTAFFMYAHGNFPKEKMIRSHSEEAWRLKTKAAYDMLRLASLNNPQLTNFLEEYRDTYSEAAMRGSDERSRKRQILFFIGCLLIIAIPCGFMIYDTVFNK